MYFHTVILSCVMIYVAQLAAVANEWVEILHRDSLGLNPKWFPVVHLFLI